MTLEELQQQVDRDFKLDDTELDAESVKIPLLHNKYLQHFNKFSLLLKKAEYDYKTLQRHKWEYYTGKSDPSVYAEKPFDLKVLKSDLSIYIESDEDIIKMENKIVYLETVIKYVDGVLKSISARGWDIKNAIQWKNFEAGLM